MKRYLAKKNGCGIYLTKTDQIIEYLEKGCDIYECDDEEEETLIGTSEKGMFAELPIIEEKVTEKIQFGGGEQ